MFCFVQKLLKLIKSDIYTSFGRLCFSKIFIYLMLFVFCLLDILSRQGIIFSTPASVLTSFISNSNADSRSFPSKRRKNDYWGNYKIGVHFFEKIKGIEKEGNCAMKDHNENQEFACFVLSQPYSFCS